MTKTSLIGVAQSIVGATLLAIAGLNIKIDAAIAQSSIQNCQLPQPGEYLLLVESRTPRSRELVRQTVPNTDNLSLCRYSNKVVTRIGGFASTEEVQKWVRYLNDIVGLQAFMVEPPVAVPAASETGSETEVMRRQQQQELQRQQQRRREESEFRRQQLREQELQRQQEIVRSQTVASQRTPAFNPQPLGTGYAILVDFFNKPEIAEQVQRLVGKQVGLVSFDQRPYLLVMHTTNNTNATNTFQLLSERGFVAMMVDSRRVTLLREQVLPNPPRN